MYEDIPLLDIIKVRVLENYCLEITFENGVEGVMDIMNTVTFDGVFEPFKDENYFRKVKVNLDTGTIEWPNGADLDPVVLYAQISEKVIQVSNSDE